jgi:predicted dehydrogenase
MQANRRKFMMQALTAAGVAIPSFSAAARARRIVKSETDIKRTTLDVTQSPRIRFSVIGLNHGHIYSQADAVIRGGGALVSFFAKEQDLADAFAKRFPDAKRARSEKEILEDRSIQLVVSASIPDERAPLGIEVMRHGKDFMADKPGIVNLKQLQEVRRVQQETKRIYSIMYSERLENPATVKAGELVKAGAIGQVIQTIGLGPHRINLKSRPSWFFEHDRYGGIICDIGAHQCDQFLFFTGSTEADVVCSQVGNVHYPQYPGLEDFGDATFRGNNGTGYIRVDWFTPDGLNTWGDARLTILGTEGFIEIRKNIDIGGREGGNHLFITDHKSTRYMDCSKDPIPYGEQLVDDILNRTETAMTQQHCFLATQLALKAQEQAQKLNLVKH